MDVISQPINYFKYTVHQRDLFPESFVRFLMPKVRKFFARE